MLVTSLSGGQFRLWCQLSFGLGDGVAEYVVQGVPRRPPGQGAKLPSLWNSSFHVLESRAVRLVVGNQCDGRAAATTHDDPLGETADADLLRRTDVEGLPDGRVMVQ